MKTKYTAFRCPVDLLAKAKVKAVAQRRSLSNYMIILIEADTRDIPDVIQPGRRKKKR